MNSLRVLVSLLGLLHLVSLGYVYPDFKCSPSDWPSLAPQTDGLGYTVPPPPSAELSAKYPISGSFLSIPVIPAPNTQNCALNSLAQLASFGANGTCWWTCNSDANGCFRSTDITTCTSTKNIGVTFSNGPSHATLNILAFLTANNLKATFFLVGSKIVQYPEIVRALIDAGMDVGIDTWSHHPLTSQTNEQIVAEIGWTIKAFQAVAGYTPTLMRPPQGDVDDRVRGIIRQMGLTLVLWNIDTQDYDTDGKSYLVGSTVTNFEKSLLATSFPKGVIVLEHDYFQGGADMAVNYFLPFYLSKGYTLKTISQCANLVQPFPTSGGSSNAQATGCTTKASSAATLLTSYSLVFTLLLVIAITWFSH